MSQYCFTSESVTEGHPDKICDKIADGVLDDILSHDAAARVACEVAVNTGLVLVFGEVSTNHYCDVAGIARRVLAEIGYTYGYGFMANSCAVLVSLDEQSGDIALGVNLSHESREGSTDPLDVRGAGDQGLMFGFACTESERLTPGTFMPLPIHLAHKLAQRLADVRKSGLLPMLKPDGKTQVTLVYDGLTPVEVKTVLISAHHHPKLDHATLSRDLYDHVMQYVLPAEICPGGSHHRVEFLTNPTGAFIKGGPEADSGLTGRKIIVDTYGGMSRHGGGSFSGKDPTKVDRSASYYARYVAKNLVAAGAAERLELQASYAIGRANPLSINITTFGSSHVPEERIEAFLASREVFDFRPQAMINQLDLLNVRYSPVAAYGHFGRNDLDLPWERLDRVDHIRQALGL